MLTLVYLARKNLNLLFQNIVERLRSILFVDITHPFLRVQYDPPYKLLHKLKMEIFTQRERLKIFNKLRFVVVTTHKEDVLSEHFFYKIGSSTFVFSQTVLVSSREMANVHYFLPPNSLSFPPLVRRLSQFLAKDFSSLMTINEIYTFLRYGSSYDYERKDEQSFNKCLNVSMGKCKWLCMQRISCRYLGSAQQ